MAQRRPVRAKREELDFVSPIFPRLAAGTLFLSGHVNGKGDISVLIEMLDNILPIEDTDVSLMLDRIFTKRKIDVRAKTKTGAMRASRAEGQRK